MAHAVWGGGGHFGVSVLYHKDWQKMAKYGLDNIGKVHQNIINVIGGLMALQDRLFNCFLSIRFQEMTSTTVSVNFIRGDEFLRGAIAPVGSKARRSRRQTVEV